MGEEERVLERKLTGTMATVAEKQADIAQLNDTLEILTANYTALGSRMGEMEAANKARAEFFDGV